MLHTISILFFVILSCAIIFYRPSIGLSLLIAFDLFYRLYLGKKYLTGLGIGTGIIIGILSLAVFIRGDYRERIKTPIDHLVLIFLSLGIIYGLIGFIRGNEPAAILGDLYHIIPEISVTFFLTTIVLNSKEKIEQFIREFSVITAVFLVFLFFEYLSGGMRALEGSSAYYYEKENFVRLGFGAIFPVFHIIIFYSLRIYAEKGWFKPLFSLLPIPLFIVLILTMRRTSWIAVTVSWISVHMFITLKHNVKTAARFLFFVFLLFTGGLFFVSQFNIRMPERLVSLYGIVGSRLESIDNKTRSLTNRITQFKDAGKILYNNPLGYGLGSKFIMHSAKGVRPIHYVHNSFLHYSIQAGILFALLYLSMFCIFCKNAIQLFFDLQGGYMKGITLGFIVSSFALMIEGITDLSINTFYFSIGMGIVFVIKKKWDIKQHGT